MEREDWTKLAMLIDNWWGTPEMDEDKEESYWLELHDYDAGDVEVAIRELLEEGGKFTPSLAEIKARLDPPEPGLSFGEAMAAISAALERRRDRENGGDSGVIRFLQTEHPLYLIFFRRRPEFRRHPFEPDSYDLSRLDREWRDLVVEWKRGEVRRHAIAAQTHRPITGGQPKSIGAVAGQLVEGGS